MTAIMTPKLCEGCEFAGTEVAPNSVIVNSSSASGISITPDGTIWYAGTDYSECGFGAGWLSPEDAWRDQPEMVASINACTEPASEVIDKPIRWPLGLLGLTKPVEVKKCPAIEASALKKIVQDQIASY